MWEVREVAGGENGGPSDMVSLRQCVKQFECIFEEATFAVCVNESFGEWMMVIETGFDDLCVEFLGDERILACQGKELRFECEYSGRVRE